MPRRHAKHHFPPSRHITFGLLSRSSGARALLSFTDDLRAHGAVLSAISADEPRRRSRRQSTMMRYYYAPRRLADIRRRCLSRRRVDTILSFYAYRPRWPLLTPGQCPHDKALLVRGIPPGIFARRDMTIRWSKNAADGMPPRTPEK